MRKILAIIMLALCAACAAPDGTGGTGITVNATAATAYQAATAATLVNNQKLQAGKITIAEHKAQQAKIDVVVNAMDAAVAMRDQQKLNAATAAANTLKASSEAK